MIPSARAPSVPTLVRMALGRIVAATRHVTSPVLVVASAMFAAEARAESPTLPVHVVVEAPASCTDEERFWAEVTSRTSELSLGPATDDSPVLFVRAWKVDGVVRGDLTLRTSHGEMLPPRGVVGRTCEEVTSALALALVLALEEGALESRAQESDDERSPAPLLVPEPESSPTTSPPRRGRPRPPRRRDDRLRIETSMGARGILGHVDGLATGVGIYSEVRPPNLSGRLSFRLEAATWRRTVARSVGEAELAWLLLRAQLCVRPFTTLALSLCGLVDGGAFTASATQARNPLSYSAPWAGAGLAVNAAWNLSRTLGIEAEAGGLAPFVGDELVLRPSVLMFATPAVVTWVGIGPVLHFD